MEIELREDGYAAVAAYRNGKLVGRIHAWKRDDPAGPEILSVQVGKRYQRKGIATELWKGIQERFPNVRHGALTENGKEWVRSLSASSQPRVPAGSPRGGQWTSTVKKVRSVLTDDLRKVPYKGACNPMTGHCYVASEALYHALGGKEAGWTPHNITHEGSPHWFLKHKDGAIIDPTADQFKTPVPYAKAKGKGFLTKQPSKRAKEVLRRAGLG